MAIDIVDFPIKNGEFPYSYVSLPEGTQKKSKSIITFLLCLTSTHVFLVRAKRLRQSRMD